MTDTYVYDAFGILLDRTGSTENNYLYTGEQYDANIGFYYLRARYYNPNVGRFLNVDPYLGNVYDPMSLHRYLYCYDNPVNYVDPSGEMKFNLTEIMVSAAIGQILAATSARIFGNVTDPIHLFLIAILRTSAPWSTHTTGSTA